MEAGKPVLSRTKLLNFAIRKAEIVIFNTAHADES